MNDQCCYPMNPEAKPEPSRYTQPRDWSLEGNRPVCCDDTQQPTTNKPATTGLIVRQPL